MEVLVRGPQRTTWLVYHHHYTHSMGPPKTTPDGLGWSEWSPDGGDGPSGPTLHHALHGVPSYHSLGICICLYVLPS